MGDAQLTLHSGPPYAQVLAHRRSCAFISSASRASIADASLSTDKAGPVDDGGRATVRSACGALSRATNTRLGVAGS